MNYDDLPLKKVRGLSLTRPWPWAFDNGPVHKRIENRSWRAPQSLLNTHHIALHAAQSWNEYDREHIFETTGLIVPPRKEHPHSIIWAVCRIWKQFEWDIHTPGFDDEQDVWAFGPWCWVISEYVKLIEPVPCKGGQGFWSFEKRQTELAHLRDVYASSLLLV